MGERVDLQNYLESTGEVSPISEIEALLDRTGAVAQQQALTELGRLAVRIDPSALKTISAWQRLLTHPDAQVRREAYHLLTDAVSDGRVPEEIADLLEGAAIAAA